MKNLSIFFTSLFLLFQTTVNSQTIVDIVVGSPNHNTLETAVIAADLAGALSGSGPFTLFAPTDAAFAAIPSDVLNTLLSDPSGDLTSILLHHAVNGVAGEDNIFDGMRISSLFGQNLEFDVTNNGLTINGANISVANIEATNGVVHVIDAVLIPEIKPATVLDVVVDSPDHNTLEAAVLAAGLEGALGSAGPFTVFAPTDAAFEVLGADVINTLLADPQGDLTEILLHHVISGVASTDNIFNGMRLSSLTGQNLNIAIDQNGARINDANITVTDIRTDNGVVHVIDAILIPELGLGQKASSVVDIVVNSPDHNTLETAVIAAGLQTALSGPGPFTVFAPTDAAFAALDPDLLNSLLADPQGALTTILTYHVSSGVAMASGISDGLKIGTLQGQNLEFAINGNGAFVNNAMITVTDIQAENGIVHVIDAVLVPDVKSATVLDIVVNSPDHNTLETAVLAAGLEGALAGPGPFTVFAPTDAAFAALPANVLSDLLADPQGALTQVLLNHVVSGVAGTDNIFNGMQLSSLAGGRLNISIDSNGAFINGAQIIVTDIEAENGIVHVIDAILVP